MPSQTQPSLRRETAALRVALVSEYYYPDIGGMPEHVHQLGRALARCGHQVTVITTEFPVASMDRRTCPMKWCGLGEPVRRCMQTVRCRRCRQWDGASATAAGAVSAAPLRCDSCPRADFSDAGLVCDSCAPPESALIGTYTRTLSIRRFAVLSACTAALPRRARRRIDGERHGGRPYAADRLSARRRDHPKRCRFRRLAVGSSSVAARQLSLHLLVQARLEPRNRIENGHCGAFGVVHDGQQRRLSVLGEGPRRQNLCRCPTESTRSFRGRGGGSARLCSVGGCLFVYR